MNHNQKAINPQPDDNSVTRLVLVGNPNVGKSVFFNALTGLYVDVSNFPGTTIDISRGRYQNFVVEDTPGVYGVSSFNDEERIARDIILQADIVLNVIDSAHLHRDLFLTQQLLDMGKKMIIAVNMMDESVKNGISIDIAKLSQKLGVPAIPAVASDGKGIEELKASIQSAKFGNAIPSILEKIQPLINKGIPQPEALLILEDDSAMLEVYHCPSQGMREDLYRVRRSYVDHILSEVISQTTIGTSFATKLGRMMLRPVTGIPLLMLTLYCIFEFVGVFVGQYMVDWSENSVMEGMYRPFISRIFEIWLTKNSFLWEVLIGEFGILTMTPIYVIGLLMPLVLGFYLVLSILEDSGYLPRIAVLTDRLMTGVGLNGRAIIPTILAFGCFTSASMTTRLLGSKRERIIATALLGLTIPCSAQMGVVAGKLASLGLVYTIYYTFILILIFGVVGKTLNAILPGESTDLFIDLPPIRMPLLKNILKKTWVKSRMFLLEATPLFAFGAFIICILKYTGSLLYLQNAISPLTVSWLKLPREAATVFIMGIVRRDFGTAGLNQLTLSHSQVFTSLVTLTLFVPCIAAIMVIYKERTKIEATLIWLGSMAVAFLTGGIVARLL